jgi:hypothetical protein
MRIIVENDVMPPTDAGMKLHFYRTMPFLGFSLPISMGTSKELFVIDCGR